MSETEDYLKTATPSAHKTTHQNGGSDQISVEGLAGELTAEQKSSWAKVSGKPSTFPPAAHKTSHQKGGSDELDVTGLVGAGASRLVQVVYYQTGNVASGATTLPVDDTIPQKTEGVEFMTLAVTPLAATNKLIVEALFCGHDNGGGPHNSSVALFKDSDAGALVALSVVAPAGGNMYHVALRHFMVAGTTSPITFKVRAGQNVAGLTTMNGVSGARIFGGVMISSILIMEVLP